MNKKRDGKEKCFDHPVNNQTELNWLRETCEKLDKERVGLTNRLLNTEAELFRLQDENSKLRKREIFHKERQVFLGHQAEELQKLIALRNQEREEILSASATDIQNLIVSQRLHCETLQRLHEEELNHCLQSKRNLECKLNLIDVTQPQEECEKENLEKEHELDLDNPQKTYSNENIKCTQREEPHGNNTNNNNHMHVKNSLADLTKVFLTLNKIHKEVQRQRNLLRLTLQQLGIETPAHIVSPLPAIKGSDFYTTMSSTVQLGEEAFSDICNLREDIAQALTEVLNKSEVKDKDSLKLEILRNQERELFNRRLKEVERDFSEKGNEWKREREHLKARILDLEVAVERKKGVQSFRDACVQSSLFSFPKTSSISKNCKNIASQTDMQQGHLSKLELYLDDMRDYINSLERDRSEWQSFAALRTSR